MPQEAGFYIYYDGMFLGRQWSDFELYCYSDQPLKIQLKKTFPKGWRWKTYFYQIGRTLILDDFEIIPNPDYRGAE
jgi:hypothetical protein